MMVWSSVGETGDACGVECICSSWSPTTSIVCRMALGPSAANYEPLQQHHVRIKERINYPNQQLLNIAIMISLLVLYTDKFSRYSQTEGAPVVWYGSAENSREHGLIKSTCMLLLQSLITSDEETDDMVWTARVRKDRDLCCRHCSIFKIANITRYLSVSTSSKIN